MDESNKEGVGNTTNQTNQEGQNVFFDSYNIGRKEKTQYFPGEQAEQKKQAKGLAKLFEGKNKFITIAVFIVVLALIVLLILWLALWQGNGDSSNNTPDPDGLSLLSGIPDESVRLSEIGEAAVQIYNGNASLDDPYAYVQAYLDEEASKPENSDIVFPIRMLMSSVYIMNQDYQKDIDYLLDFDLASLSNEYAISVCKDLVTSYSALGDDEKAGYYMEQQSHYLELMYGKEAQ